MADHLKTCNARVPDNGDTYRCGSAVDVREGLCSEHRPDAILNVENRIKLLKVELSAYEQHLKRLKGEA